MSTMDKIKAKVENVLHKDSATGTTHNDPTGPHNTHAANKADPRVDSDRVGTAGNTSGAGGIGGGQYAEGHHTGAHHAGHSGGLTGTTGTGGLTGSSGYSDPTGPHDSRVANKMDPRVDSDRPGVAGNTSGAGGIDGRQYAEHTTGHQTTGHYVTGDHTGSHHTTGHRDGGLTGTTGTGSGYSDPTGPHNTRLANQLDPRVDSDRTGPAGNTAGAGGFGGGQYTEGHHTGAHHTGAHTGTHGAGVGGIGGAGAGNTMPGSGTAPNTAGPHNSDLLNKVDPRVDSDLSGGKTYGGNATNQ